MTRAVLLTAAILALWLGSCSVLVDPESKPPRCALKDGKPDPCPSGSACVEGRCRSGCIPELCDDQQDNDCDGQVDERGDQALELCGNQRDDDCDGATDEQADANRPETCGNGVDDDCDGKQDEGHDQDMDGVTWCGNTIMQNGGGLADCDDYDPSVHPGLKEICDGRDNDCDDRIDETTSTPLCPEGLACLEQRCQAGACSKDGSGTACGPGQRCDEQTGTCVAEGCTPGSCAAPQYCDQASGECRTTRRRNGEACVAHGDCASGSCMDRAALRIRSEAPRLCGQACCSDEDCNAGERCYVSGSGARACLPASLTPRPTNSPRQCLDDDQCGEGQQICAVVDGQKLIAPAEPTRDNLISPACRQPGFGTLDLGRGCSGDAACASAACVSGPGLIPPNVCSRPCGSSADCQRLEEEADGLLSISPRSYCRFVSRGSSQDYLPLCVFARTETGSGAFGAPCATSSACLEGACVGAAGDKPGMCSVTCCRDTDCPSLNDAPTVCRPVAFGQHFEMRCMP